MIPWYTAGGVAIHVGHVLDVLAGLPAGSVQTCITSPPYWGLRAYGTDPQIWGGDPMCSHSLEATAPGKVLTGGAGTASAKQVSNAGSQYGNAWVEETWYRAGGGAAGSSAEAFSAPGPENAARIKAARWDTAATCTRCGAWRGELGSEPTPAQYVANIVAVFRAVRRVLRDDGTLWVNLGDSYAGSGKGGGGGSISERSHQFEHIGQNNGGLVPAGLKPKDLVGIPWRVAFALQADGWYLRADIIWSKPNPMPESVTDRPTKAHEYLFLLSKRAEYYYDAEAIREPYKPESLGRYAYSLDGTAPTARQPQNGDVGRRKREAGVRDPNPAGRNRRSVWTIPTESYPAAHFATYPRKLVEPCMLAGTSARGQCPACGAPWRRQTDVTRTFESGSGRSGTLPVGKNGAHLQGGGATLDIRRGPIVHTQTTGWEPGCSCDARDPVPQTVLDPFLGSGTTAYVARHHGRRAVGIELNESYARLAADRLRQGVLGLEVW